jgi:hypothetical protein
MLAVPLAAPASALTPSVSCAKLTASTTLAGKNATTKSALAGCTPAALAAGGTSTVTTPSSNLFGKITSTMKWNNGKGTTTMVEQYKTTTGKSKCPAGQSHILLTGTTNSSTGAAAKIIKSGEPIKASICTNTKKQPYVSTLEPGTKFAL